jgi:hypothetical protein
MVKLPFIFRLLQTIAIVLLAFTISMTLLGGAGTTCVAFKAENWDSMATLVPVKPVFQVLVFVSIIAGIAGIFATVRLAKGRKNGYAQVLLFLIISGAASAIQFYFSATLRGKTVPNNMRLYITIFTLAYLLLLRIPGIWEKMPFNHSQYSSSGLKSGGIALCFSGLVTLTTPLWAAPTHIMDGYNTANELLIPLVIAGGILLLGGLSLLRVSGIQTLIKIPFLEGNS